MMIRSRPTYEESNPTTQQQNWRNFDRKNANDIYSPSFESDRRENFNPVLVKVHHGNDPSILDRADEVELYRVDSNTLHEAIYLEITTPQSKRGQNNLSGNRRGAVDGEGRQVPTVVYGKKRHRTEERRRGGYGRGENDYVKGAFSDDIESLTNYWTPSGRRQVPVNKSEEERNSPHVQRENGRDDRSKRRMAHKGGMRNVRMRNGVYAAPSLMDTMDIMSDGGSTHDESNRNKTFWEKWFTFGGLKNFHGNGAGKERGDTEQQGSTNTGKRPFVETLLGILLGTFVCWGCCSSATERTPTTKKEKSLRELAEELTSTHDNRARSRFRKRKASNAGNKQTEIVQEERKKSALSKLRCIAGSNNGAKTTNGGGICKKRLKTFKEKLAMKRITAV